jgi:hypothetical protein
VTRCAAAMRAIAAALSCSTVLAAPLIAPLERELTPADALATVRVMQDQILGAEPSDDELTSPDGQRYLIRLAHGDFQHNGVWMDLLTGRLSSLEAASHPVRCAHLFTTGLGSPASGQSADADVEPTNIARWITPSQVAFLWSNAHAIRQIMSVDLKTCTHRFLTASPTPVFSFAIAHGGALLFNAQVPRAIGVSRRLWCKGFTLNEAANGWSILNGDIDGTDSVSLGYLNAWFLRSGGRLRRIAISNDPIDHSNPFYRELSISPSGRYAVIGTSPSRAPESWKEYSSASLHRLLESNATSVIKVPVNYTLIDLRDGKSRELWNAPKDYTSQVSWSPDDDRILLVPTFLPANEHSAAGLAGTAAAVLDVATGQYAVLPIDLRSRTVTNARWLATRAIEITSSNEMGEDLRSQHFALGGTAWVAFPASAPNALADKSTPRIRVQIQQDLNHPPQILGVDSKSGDTRLILDPNPNLQLHFKLGRVERLSGTLTTGRQWIAQLLYPADYEAGRHYPLLIQSLYGHGFGAEAFNLYGFWGWGGMGLGPSAFAAYPGQLLATRNIAVLQLEVLHPAPGAQQAEDYQLAFETLAEQLSASGLIDRNKIALDGFSRNGYWVEYTISHSQFPFAAAIAADNYDPSYFPSALFNWRAEDATANGAAAFGEGLRDWLARAPGFNAEHIHTPLRIIGQSAGIPLIIGEWEIYSRLKHLHRPVEMFMMPSVDTHPSHNPQNPRQIIAVQESVIDWFSFWLTGREDPAPEKRAQYERWRRMRDSRHLGDSGEISDPQL